MNTLSDKLSPGGPKRILALDGGGIRGALTLGFVKKIEDLLRTRYQKKDLVLSDYFDFIGGTSTGAIIAAALSVGKSADEIATLYQELGGKIFEERTFAGKLGAFGKLLKSTYKKNNLEEALTREFGDIEICGPELKTGLCILMKRADTYGTWPITNHPEAIYNKSGDNNRFLLRQLVRASAAAPTFFPLEEIIVGKNGEKGVFVDGGVSMFNNPAYMMFLIATILKGFPFQWPKGEDKVMLVSLGTGFHREKIDLDNVKDLGHYWASEIPEMLMWDANKFNQMMLQSISNSETAIAIDREIGSMKGDLLSEQPLLNYLRYNVEFEKNNLAQLGFPNVDIQSICQMDKAENRGLLADIGRAASSQIKDSHFKKEFDIM